MNDLISSFWKFLIVITWKSGCEHKNLLSVVMIRNCWLEHDDTMNEKEVTEKKERWHQMRGQGHFTCSMNTLRQNWANLWDPKNIFFKIFCKNIDYFKILKFMSKYDQLKTKMTCFKFCLQILSVFRISLFFGDVFTVNLIIR